MESENQLMKRPNQQGYRILDGESIHSCSDPKVIFEWALIDRGEGKSPCVGHWVSFTDNGYMKWEDIQWGYGHYFDTLEEAEVYYREQIVKEIEGEVRDLCERLGYARAELLTARALLPNEEDI